MNAPHAPSAPHQPTPDQPAPHQPAPHQQAQRDALRAALGLLPGELVLAPASTDQRLADAFAFAYVSGIAHQALDNTRGILPRLTPAMARVRRARASVNIDWRFIETEQPLDVLLPAADLAVLTTARPERGVRDAVRECHRAGVPVVGAATALPRELYDDESWALCAAPGPREGQLVTAIARLARATGGAPAVARRLRALAAKP